MVIIEQKVCIVTTLTIWEMWILSEKEAFRQKKKNKKKQPLDLYTKLNVYFCSKNPMYKLFLCGCYGNLYKICIATINELFEKVCLEKRCSKQTYLRKIIS